MTTTAFNIADLKSHVGRTLTATDILHPGPANLLRLAFNRAEPELHEGDPLPPAWLALYFLPRFATAELRPDGSPRDTGVIPPMPLPRRMFAGERVRLHRTLRLGQAVRRETELADISLKTGGTGTLVFVTVTSRVFGPEGLALEDERRTAFREEVRAGERNRAPRREPAPADVPWRRQVVPDPVLLFRFSALTFNSHRIHYDLPYACQQEGYRGLVVHGPLTATLLLDLAQRQFGDNAVRRFDFRGTSPAICGEELHLALRGTGDAIELGAFAADGRQVMAATATI
jgi:3-methylfumaryl-CoA hydratase